jgi:hypothetical protein
MGGDGCIYVFGGLCSDGDHLSTSVSTNGWYTSSAERFDPEEKTWVALKPLPSKGQACAASVGNDVFVFVHGSACFRYSPATDTYVRLCDLPEKNWFSFDVTVFGRRVLLCGGTVDGRWSTVLWEFDAVTSAFSKLPNMSFPRRRTAITAVQVE